MTPEAVSAIDFGPCNSNMSYQPPDFVELLQSVGEGNPGRCWVSIKCFLPQIIIDGWIQDTISNLSNLDVYYNTVIKAVDTTEGLVTAIHAIQRIPKIRTDQWNYFLSETIEDWYSVEDSDIFSKNQITFEGASDAVPLVVIEATELGDVLVLSGATYRQGIEVPTEESEDTLETCGQAITYPFYVMFNVETVEEDDKLVNTTYDDYTLRNFTWGEVWSYRRSLGHEAGERDVPKPGEVSNQNWGTEGGNDYLDGYLLLPYEHTEEQKADWKGGVNITTLGNAEIRSLGFYTWYKEAAVDGVSSRLSLGVEDIVGTGTGLSKIPYLRDTRRSVGLDDFVLYKRHLENETVMFHDRIALGDYLYADTHPISTCEHPAYLEDNHISPYYIPFRALTNRDLDNVLVVGKNMAQSYFANAATRLHPEEWGTGLAGGLAAILMSREGYNTREVYENVEELQEQIRKLMPLEWGEC